MGWRVAVQGLDRRAVQQCQAASFGLYDQWVAAFAVLFRQVGGNWPAFYARVRALGQLLAERQAALQRLAAAAP